MRIELCVQCGIQIPARSVDRRVSGHPVCGEACSRAYIEANWPKRAQTPAALKAAKCKDCGGLLAARTGADLLAALIR